MFTTCQLPLKTGIEGGLTLTPQLPKLVVLALSGTWNLVEGRWRVQGCGRSTDLLQSDE